MLNEVLDGVHGRVTGTQAVLLVGKDGVIVTGSTATETAKWEWVVAGWSDIINRAGRAGREAQLGNSQELCSVHENTTLLFRSINDDYGLLLALHPGQALLGRARYEARRAATELQPELAA